MCVIGYRSCCNMWCRSGIMFCWVFCCQAEDGIRDLVRSRGLGDVYKRQRLPEGGTDVSKVTFRYRDGTAHDLDVEDGNTLMNLSLIHI